MLKKKENILSVFARGVAVAILVIACAPLALADDVAELPSVLRKVYHHKEYFVNAQGDTCIRLVMNDVIVYPPERFKNRKDEEFYWKTVRDVKKTLPYAKLINATLQETYEYIQTFPTHKEREAYLKKFEKEVFRQYKPEMKKMTKSQGKMLIKLINRETDQNSYNIVKAFMGTFRAGFWQTFGRFFGVNMKSGFHPEKNDDDALIERICVRVEAGLL